MDTFHPERLKKIMRFGTLEEIEAGIAAAEAAGLRPIKINCVVTRDYNDMDVVDVARRALRARLARALHRADAARAAARPRTSRCRSSCPRARRASASRPSWGRSSRCPTRTPPTSRGTSASRAARASSGFISPVSEPYCGTCNRMRLTADGKFHLCLLNDDEMDVRKALRAGGGVPAAAAILARAVGAKPTGHRLDEGVSTEDRQMFQIGG